MDDDTTAVVEPTEASAEPATETGDTAPEPASDPAPAEATPDAEVSQPEEPEPTFSKKDLESRVTTELHNQRQKWEKEQAQATEAAIAEALQAEREATSVKAGQRANVEQVWMETAQAVGIDLNRVREEQPAVVQKLAQAFMANEAFADFNASEQFRSKVLESHPDIPAETVAAATRKAHTGDPAGAAMDLFDAAVEHRATQIASEAREKAQKEANERVEAEKQAMDMEAVQTAPATPPGSAPVSGTIDDLLMTNDTNGWLKLSAEEKETRRQQAQQLASRGR